LRVSSCTNRPAVFLGLKIVAVAVTASVNELLAGAGRGVEVPPLEGGLAGAGPEVRLVADAFWEVRGL